MFLLPTVFMWVRLSLDEQNRQIGSQSVGCETCNYVVIICAAAAAVATDDAGAVHVDYYHQE